VSERGRIAPGWAWLAGLLWYLGRLNYLLGGPLPPAALPALQLALDGLLGAAVLGALTGNSRRAEPIGKRRIKWVLYGAYVSAMVLFCTVLFGLIRPTSRGLVDLYVLSALAWPVFPLCILIGVVRFNLFDINRLISATASYNVLIMIFVVVGFGVVPHVARAASVAIGIDPSGGQLILSLGLAAVVIPAHRTLRPQIDRIFFPESHRLEQGIEALIAGLSSCDGAQALIRLAGESLDELLRPATCVVYARDQETYRPVFVRGRPVPSMLGADEPLILVLRQRTAPLLMERRAAPPLTPFERAALETLSVSLVVPVHRGAEFVGFACFGPKRSGDVYTSTDLALLIAVADKVSTQWLRFEDGALIREARVTHEALRRYVPGAVAERIVSGKDVEAGEREVTVLFVDIRGYTGLSEQREAEEIFRTVNRYTETVSKRVQTRGGVVVEFSGDGMLAVFGAPDVVPMKERAAVQAARDILAAVAALPGPGGSAAPALSVGVGIATGPAFVGTIQSADRSIWTVIGDTVNLAARLQSLTRELAAAVAIDDTTFRRAGRGACADFLCRGDLAVRGRTEPETVHALPLRELNAPRS